MKLITTDDYCCKSSGVLKTLVARGVVCRSVLQLKPAQLNLSWTI